MKAKIKQLRKEGKTYKEISKITGLTKSTISYHCNDNVKINTLKRQKIRRNNIKLALVQYKGGKCEKCGYNKCIAALEFHHVNTKEKEFTIAKHNTKSFIHLKKEVDKCMLLCSNCHKEIHYKYKPE